MSGTQVMGISWHTPTLLLIVNRSLVASAREEHADLWSRSLKVWVYPKDRPSRSVKVLAEGEEI